MFPLSILLLGPPQVSLSGEPLHLGRRKAVALLAYLAANPTAHPRDTLATLLWPESNRSTTRANLRRTLSELTRALGRDFFSIDNRSVRLPADEDIYVDLAEFHRLGVFGRQRWQSDGGVVEQARRLPQLAAAADLVRGPFLEGFSLSDSVLFDDWQMLQTESIRHSLHDLLAQLATGYQALGEPDRAIVYARRWVTLDPLQGQANRALMALLAETDRAAEALRHFRKYERLLEDELNIPPEADVTELFEAIRTGNFTPASVEGPHSQAPDAPSNSAAASLHLPRQATSFIGRQEEIAELGHLLCDERDCQLVTLDGPGGVGKTRLALAAAEAMAPRFADGVVFISLFGVSDATFILSAIAEGLNLQIASKSERKSQVLAYLRNRSLLLILDNVEQLFSEGAPESETFIRLMVDLLAAAPGLRLLLTSREPLNIQSEWVLPVIGLGYPAMDEPPRDGDLPIERYGAMELFYHRARRLHVHIDLQRDWRAMARICRHVDGMPLAIELAAPWTQSLSCDEIADQIEEGMDLLATTMRDVEPRHRSIRRVFERTWQMLPAEEQYVLSRLSVFQGGFTRLAAEQVAGATLPHLSVLVSKTLLRRDENGRYDSQELLRQFCADKLAAEPAATNRTRDRHCSYFTSLMAQRYEALLRQRPVETYRELSLEIDNLNAAWAWAVEQGNLVAMDNAFEVYWQLLDWRGAGEEIIAIFGNAAQRLEEMRGSDEAEENRRLCLHGEVLVPHGQRKVHNWGLNEEGLAIAERGLALIQLANPTDRRKEFWALVQLGMACLEIVPARAKQVCDECIRLCHETGDGCGLLVAHTMVAWHFIFKDDLANAWVHARESHTLTRQFGVNRWSIVSLELQTMMKTHEGAYAEAKHAATRLFEAARELKSIHYSCNSLALRAQLARIRGDYDSARMLYEDKALSLVERSGVPDREPFLRLKLSALARLAGDYEEANRQLEAGAAIIERLHMNQASLFAERGRLALAQHDYGSAEKYLRIAGSGDHFWLPLDNFDSSIVDLGDVLCAMGDDDADRTYRRSLRKSRTERTLPQALQALGGLAHCCAQNGDIERALELANLVQRHPATWHEHRVRAEDLVQRLAATMSSEIVKAVYRRAGERTPWDVVDEVLAEELPGCSVN